MCHVPLFTMRPVIPTTLRHIIRNVPRSRGYHASVLPSLISTASPEFQAKSTAMDELVHDLEDKMAKARLGGGPRAAERMRNKGKKLPRERLVHPASL
jgi:3-methylcrotonyl-CoA carboxylase beta subunit